MYNYLYMLLYIVYFTYVLLLDLWIYLKNILDFSIVLFNGFSWLNCFILFFKFMNQ